MEDNTDLKRKKQSFNLVALKMMLKSHFTDPKVRITDKTVRLVAFVLQSLTEEAILRAGKEAQRQGDKEIDLIHIEKVLPLLMLDFS